MRVGVDCRVARNAGTDVDHRAPLRKARTLVVIFLQPLGELVEADGDQLVRAAGQRLRAFVDLDAGDRACLLDQLDQRRAVLRLLPDRLIVEDHAGDVLRHRVLRAEQQLAIIAAIVLGRVDADRVETLLDGAGGFIRGQNSAARRDHGVGDFVEIGEVHACLLQTDTDIADGWDKEENRCLLQ
jgi:hypothetical protein